MREVDKMFEGLFDLKDLYRHSEANFKNLQDVFQRHINEEKSVKLRSTVFFYKGEDFPTNTDFDDLSISGEEFKDITKIHLKRRINRKDLEGGYRDIEGIFFLHRIRDDYYIALTLEDRDFFEKGLLKLLKYLAPKYTKPVLTSHEILDMLYSYTGSEEKSYHVVPKQTVFYDRSDSSDISHTYNSLDDISYRCKEENLYVNKIRFEIREKYRLKFSGVIDRDGSIEFKEGEIWFMMDLIDKIHEPAEQKSAIFMASDRNDFKRLTKKSIVLQYDISVLSDVDDNQRLFSALGNIPKSDFMIFHYNPYLHVSFFDYIDGSKFDIFGLDDKTLTLIPHKNASESAFNRMVERLQKEFGEGCIDEYLYPDYSLKDIMV